MYRGTTPTLVLHILSELDFEKLTQVWITLKSISNELTKTIDDVSFDDEEHTISTQLTQEETLQFAHGTVEIQIRFLTEDGLALATPIKKAPFDRLLKGGVIEDDRN